MFRASPTAPSADTHPLRSASAAASRILFACVSSLSVVTLLVVMLVVASPFFAPAGMLAFYTPTGLRYTNGTAAWCIDAAPAGKPVPVRSCEP